jgi:WD40 repeat protein
MFSRLVLVLCLICLTSWACAQPPAIQPANAKAAETLGGLAGPGFAIAYGEKDGMLVAACEHRALHYWLRPTVVGIRSGDNTPHVLPAHQAPVTALAWDGGATLASAGGDQRILLWSMPEGKLRTELSGHAGAVRCLALSPDGKLLASAGDDIVIRLWEVATGKLTDTLEGHRDWVMALAFSADGKVLASGSFDGSVRLWNLGGTDKIPVIPIRPAPLPDRDYHVLSLAFSPDGKLLAAGGDDAQIRLFDTSSGNPVRALQGHTSSVTSLAFHPTGTLLVSGSRDRTVRLWNPTSGQAFKTLEGHQSWVNGVVFVDRATRLASVSADQTVRLWELK